MSEQAVPVEASKPAWSIPRRFVVLDSWRGIAALWVVAYHFRVMGHITEWTFIRSGWIAVDFFFVLSGFVIWHGFGKTMTRPASGTRFLVRRFGRLYPLHVVMLAVVVAMELARWGISLKLGHSFGPAPFTGDRDWRLIPANLLLIHGIGLFPHFSWNIPSWSISVEFALCFAFVWVARLRQPMMAAAALAILGMAAVFAIPAIFPHPTESATALARGVSGFFLGMLIRESYEHRKDWTPSTWHELLAVVAIVGSIYLPIVLATLAFGYAVWIFGFETGGVSRLMKRPAVVRQGDLSYSIYLTHYPLVLIAFAIAGLFGLVPKSGSMVIAGLSPWLADIIVVLFLMLVVALSTVTYRWIEDPARKYFNKRASAIGERKSQMDGPELGSPSRGEALLP